MHAFQIFEPANDPSPLFPDLASMSPEEFDAHEPPPERLGFYALHTEEARKAFLYDLYWIGYPGLFIASNHVWKLLIAPRAYRCTLMGQHSGAGGAGKAALVNTLKQFIGEALETFEYEYPPVAEFESLDAWHHYCMEMNVGQEAEVQRIVAKYESILSGEDWVGSDMRKSTLTLTDTPRLKIIECEPSLTNGQTRANLDLEIYRGDDP